MLNRKTEGEVAKSSRALGPEVDVAGQMTKMYLAKIDIIMRKQKSRTAVLEAQAVTQRQQLKVLVKHVFPVKRNEVVLVVRRQ